MADVPLKEHIERRLESVEQATTLAARALEKRLEGMNEFREALKNQSATFVTRAELTVQVAKCESDIRMLREYKASLEGKASQLYVTITLVIALVSMFTSLVALISRIGI
jgi:hypothetical protein